MEFDKSHKIIINIDDVIALCLFSIYDVNKMNTILLTNTHFAVNK